MTDTRNNGGEAAESAIAAYWKDNHTTTKHGRSELIWTECPRVTCGDGFVMSVQASHAHYCTPRDYVADGSYSEWEIGFPSARDELLMPYVEDASCPTETVYGYVPTEVVDAVIAAHGGLTARSPSSKEA